MSFACADIEIPNQPSEDLGQDRWRRLLPCLIIALIGLLSLGPVLVGLWRMWTNDALRSVGMLFPIVSGVLILSVWNRLDWEMDGTWWGFLPLFYAIAATLLGGKAYASFVLNPHEVLSLLPAGLTVFSYASGVILLFGGARVWRRASIPLSLLLFLNPVPPFFTSLVDLRLQYISARATRAFATALGLHVDGQQLRLMFAPQFGMFIAPGCNGIRGGITMAYAALILGYVYRLSLRTWMLAALGGLTLGYAFNLIRLCVLVLFYSLALHIPFLQPYAEFADYLIGAVLFVIGTTLFVLLIRREGNGRSEHQLSKTAARRADLQKNPQNRAVRWKQLALSALIVMAASRNIYGYGIQIATTLAHREPTRNLSDLLPRKMGHYELIRTWEEWGPAHNLRYIWSSYAKSNTSSEFDVGLYGPSGVHYATGCHISRGEDPLWSAVKALPTAKGGVGIFEIDAYQDGNTYLLEASTVCTPGGCDMRKYVPLNPGFHFRASSNQNVDHHPSVRSQTILIRNTSATSDRVSPDEILRANTELQDFIADLNTADLDQVVAARDK